LKITLGGMRERLKRAVLKTAVRETVPGVRIPLPPPLTQLAQKNLASFTGQLVRSCLTHLEHNNASENCFIAVIASGDAVLM
jgi:hypothetical protein